MILKAHEPNENLRGKKDSQLTSIGCERKATSKKFSDTFWITLHNSLFSQIIKGKRLEGILEKIKRKENSSLLQKNIY